MKITAFITPRQVGKTKHGIYHFMTDPENTVFVSLNKGQAPVYITKKFPSNHVSLNQMKYHGGFQSQRFKRAILDEYLLYPIKERIELHDKLSYSGVEEVIVLSTPKICYDKFLFEYVRNLRSSRIPKSIKMMVDDIKENYSDLYPKVKYDINGVMEDISELSNNYLTHPNCRIYDAQECLQSGAFNTNEHRDRLSDGVYSQLPTLRTEGYGEYLVGYTSK